MEEVFSEDCCVEVKSVDVPENDVTEVAKVNVHAKVEGCMLRCRCAGRESRKSCMMPS